MFSLSRNLGSSIGVSIVMALQATMITYDDDFKLLMWICLAAIPVVMLIRGRQREDRSAGGAAVME